MKKRLIAYCILFIACIGNALAQERIYVSTGRNSYVVGEDIWCSVYCMGDNPKEFSQESSVAYLEFHSAQGLEETLKLALIEGRGCGRLQIPFSFATGNYSIVAYTDHDILLDHSYLNDDSFLAITSSEYTVYADGTYYPKLYDGAFEDEKARADDEWRRSKAMHLCIYSKNPHNSFHPATDSSIRTCPIGESLRPFSQIS